MLATLQRSCVAPIIITKRVSLHQPIRRRSCQSLLLWRVWLELGNHYCCFCCCCPSSFFWFGWVFLVVFTCACVCVCCMCMLCVHIFCACLCVHVVWVWVCACVLSFHLFWTPVYSSIKECSRPSFSVSFHWSCLFVFCLQTAGLRYYYFFRRKGAAVRPSLFLSPGRILTSNFRVNSPWVLHCTVSVSCFVLSTVEIFSFISPVPHTVYFTYWKCFVVGACYWWYPCSCTCVYLVRRVRQALYYFVYVHDVRSIFLF